MPRGIRKKRPISDVPTIESVTRKAADELTRLAMAPPPPPPPNPVVTKLEEKIAELVEDRQQMMENLVQANAQVLLYQNRVQRIEQEIQYRFGVIAQMKGEKPVSVFSTDWPVGLDRNSTIANYAPPANPSAAQGQFGSIASVPSRTRQAGGEAGVRSETAEDVRNSL